MGLLDSDSLKALLAQFAPGDDDTAAARKRAIMMLGFGMMGARKGDELGTVGRAGIGAVNSYNDSLDNSRRTKLAQVAGASGLLGLQDRMQASQDDQKARGVLSNFQMPSGPPGSMPSAAFTPEVNATKTPQKPMGIFEQLMAKADALDAAQLPMQAEKYRETAMKYAPKYKGTETVMQDGKPVLLQTYENQAPEPMKYQPTPKFREVNRGGQVDIVNDYTLPQSGASFNSTMTPAQIEQNRIAQAHLRIAQDKASQEKGEQFGTPIQITTPEGGTQLMIPKKGTNQVVPMTDQTGQPVSKSASIPQAYKDKAYTLSNLRGAVKDYQDTLNNFSFSDYSSPTKITELQSKYGVAQMGLKGAFELGVINGPDMKLLAQNLADPTSIKGIALPKSALEAQNKVLNSMLDRQEKNLAKAYNQRGPESAKDIVRTGTEKGTGRKVVEYSDGTRAYQ